MGRGRPALAVMLAALALGGCGGGESGVEGPVTVYVSLPLTGPRADDGRDAADGARLALDRASATAGGLEVRATYMDDARGRVWDPVAVGKNARRAAQDSSAAAYIGELDSEPTRGSAPITNDAGIVQVSPGASAIDLTGPAEGYPDSPDRYRPSGSATFARVVPSDAVQARALAEWAAALKLTVVSTLVARGPFEQLMLQEFTTDLEELGVQADPITESPPGGVQASFKAGDAPTGPGLLRAANAHRRVAGQLDPENLPRGAFTTDFIGRYARSPGPYAAYGYEAMRVVLEAIKDADGSDQFRTAVVDGVIGSEHPDSVLGLYSITSEGDSTLCAVQRYERPWEGGGEVAGEAVCPRP